jgi:hypothetical protein
MPNSQTPKSPGADLSSGATSTGLDQDTLRTDANAVKEEIGSVANQVKDEAMQQAGQLAEQAKAQVADAAEKVKGIAGEQKEFIAGQLGGVADAVERVATDLEGQNASSAQYARMIADNAEKLSSLVRDNDVDRLLSMAQDFGRRQPVAFLGAAALLGFAASRFVTASAQRQQQRESEAAIAESEFRPNGTVQPEATSTFDQGRV